MMADPVAAEQIEVAEPILQIAESARWAPSVHNTQPWRFVPLPDGLEVHEDRALALPVLDPRGRLRTISCGAALLNGRLAVAAQGRRAIVKLGNDAGGTLLGTVRRGPARRVSQDDLRQFTAVRDRRSHRRLHRREPVPDEAVMALRVAATLEGAHLAMPGPAERREYGVLLREAVRRQLEDPAHLAEIGRWLRDRPGSGPQASDGVPVGSLGPSPFPVDSLVHQGWATRVIDRVAVEQDIRTSTLLGIETHGDTRHDWLIAGAALQRLWLEATSRGLVITFADQAVQRADTRDTAAAIMGVRGRLQIVVRVGRPLVDVPPTPRRQLADLWLVEPTTAPSG